MAQSDVLVIALELGDLLLRLVLGDAVALLDPAHELIAPAFDDRPVVVGQLAPFLLGLAGELLPVTLDPIPVHPRLSAIYPRTLQENIDADARVPSSPHTHRADIDMDEVIARVGADAAGLERHGGTVQMPQRHAVHADVGGVAEEMLAVRGRCPAFALQQLVGGGGAIAGQDAERPPRLEPLADAMQQLQQIDIDRRHRVAVEIAHQPIDVLERVRDVAAVAPEDVLEALVGMRVVEQQAPLAARKRKRGAGEPSEKNQACRDAENGAPAKATCAGASVLRLHGGSVDRHGCVLRPTKSLVGTTAAISYAFRSSRLLKKSIAERQ